MFVRAVDLNMPSDRHIERWIREGRSHRFRPHHRLKSAVLQHVSAREAVWSELPNITQPRYRRRPWYRRGGFCIERKARLDRQLIDFGCFEAGDAKIDVKLAELGDLDPQHCFVPTSILGDLVVGERIEAQLLR